MIREYERSIRLVISHVFLGVEALFGGTLFFIPACIFLVILGIFDEKKSIPTTNMMGDA